MRTWKKIHGNAVNESLAKVTAADVREIRELAAKGFTSRDMALVFDISHVQISRIINRRCWRHVA